MTEPPDVVQIDQHLVPMPIVMISDASGARVYNATVQIALGLEQVPTESSRFCEATIEPSRWHGAGAPNQPGGAKALGAWEPSLALGVVGHHVRNRAGKGTKIAVCTCRLYAPERWCSCRCS